MYCGPSWLCVPRPRKKTTEDYQKEVLTYIFEKEIKKSLKIPYRKLRFVSDTAFAAAIPVHMIEPFIHASQNDPIVQEKIFKKHDSIVWKSSTNRNVTERATFVKHSSANNLQVTIRLEKKNISFSRNLNVPISEIEHYKDFLKSFLQQGPRPTGDGVTVIESHQGRSTEQPKAVETISPFRQRKMENSHTKVTSDDYAVGKYVHNKVTKQCAEITHIQLINSDRHDKFKLLVTYKIVPGLPTGEVKNAPTQGGTVPLAHFMNDWEPGDNLAPQQPTSSRANKMEESMETEDVKNIESKHSNHGVNNRETEYRDSKYFERKISQRRKLSRKGNKDKIETDPYNKLHRNSSRQNKETNASANDLVNLVRDEMKHLNYKVQQDGVIPSTSSAQATYRNKEQLQRNTICPPVEEVGNRSSPDTETEKMEPKQRSPERKNKIDQSIIHSTDIREHYAVQNRKNSRERPTSHKRRLKQQSTESGKLPDQDIPNSIDSQEIAAMNWRNSQDVQVFPEVQKNRETFTECRKSQDEIINEGENKNSLQNQKDVLPVDNNPPQHSRNAGEVEEFGDRDRYDHNRDTIQPKIKQGTRNNLLNKMPQKFAHIQKELLKHETELSEDIPEHRKFSTIPGLFPPADIAHTSNKEIKPQCSNYIQSPAAQQILSRIPHSEFEDRTRTTSIEKGERESMSSEKMKGSHFPSSSNDGKREKSVDPGNFIQSFDINRFCGGRKGIQGRNNSCYLDSTLFSLFYCTSIFDKITLEDNEKDDKMAKDVKSILRDRIVRPLRQNHFCDSENINDLRCVMATLNKKIGGSFMDAEELIFLLFEDVLKLKEFIKYSSEAQDFMHQIVPNPADRTKCQTVQVLFENSLKVLGNMKLADVPSPALILEMPRSDGRLVQYEAIIPNLSLDISTIMENAQDRKLCLCDKVATLECATCKSSGNDAVSYCEDCKDTSQFFHQSLAHFPELIEIRQKVLIMDLIAVICIRSSHYVAFVRSGCEITSPWLFFDSMAGAYPEVTHVEDLGECLETLGKNPNFYHQGMRANHFLRRILTDSHICVYHSRNIPARE